MSTPDNGLSAILLKITEHAERLSLLEASVTDNLTECQIASAGMVDAVADLRQLVEEQGRLLEAVSELVKTVVPPGEDGDGDEDDPGYKPRPPVQWWKLTGDKRQKEVDHLAAWVDQVFRPFYGHLAAMLADCWQDHPLCLVGLDIVSELHSVLNLQPKRSASLLSAQAEFSTRILPAFTEQWRTECAKCEHRPAATGSTWRGAR